MIMFVDNQGSLNVLSQIAVLQISITTLVKDV